ncbi:hypothetical protein NQ318_015741, partial [Aromia moschata]
RKIVHVFQTCFKPKRTITSIVGLPRRLRNVKARLLHFISQGLTIADHASLIKDRVCRRAKTKKMSHGPIYVFLNSSHVELVSDLIGKGSLTALMRIIPRRVL